MLQVSCTVVGFLSVLSEIMWLIFVYQIARVLLGFISVIVCGSYFQVNCCVRVKTTEQMKLDAVH